MKTTIDIPEQALADAMRFTGAKTKREAVVRAIEEFNRRNKVDQVIGMFGTWTDFPTNDELEAADVADMERKIKEWNAKDEEPHTD